MDTRQALEVATRYVALVRETFPVRSAWLFGSCATGSCTDDSDIDVALVLEGPFDGYEAQLSMMRLRRGIDTRLEPHPFADGDFNAMHPLAGEILRSGIRVDE